MQLYLICFFLLSPPTPSLFCILSLCLQSLVLFVAMPSSPSSAASWTVGLKPFPTWCSSLILWLCTWSSVLKQVYKLAHKELKIKISKILSPTKEQKIRKGADLLENTEHVWLFEHAWAKWGNRGGATICSLGSDIVEAKYFCPAVILVPWLLLNLGPCPLRYICRYYYGIWPWAGGKMS